MAVTIAQAQAVTAQAQIALQAQATTHAAAQAAVIAALSRLAGSATVTPVGMASARVVVRLPSLATRATLSAHASAGTVGTLALAATASLSAAQHAAAVSWIGPLRAALHVQGTNFNSATVVVTLPPLRSTASLTAHAAVQATGRLPLATAGALGASQAAHAIARLWLAAVQGVTAASTARITATLGPLAASLSILPPPLGYAADGNYYVALAARPFYATLAARPFYVLSNPNMTPTFDTLDPRETLVLTLDASNDLASGETLTALSTLTATQQSGLPGALPTLTGPVINAQPLTVIVGGKNVTVAASCAVQVIASGGVSGCLYLIAATCTTSNPDKILTLKGVLPVSAN